jgi:glutamate 5-kinase
LSSKGFTRQGLDIVCKIGGAEHLRLVRKTLDSDFVDYSRHDVEFLQKLGEWQDIPLIIAASGRTEAGISLLGSDYHAKYRSAAKAMYAIGKDRLTELLEKEMPKSLLARLIIKISDKSFRTLTNAQLNRLLFDADDSVRKASALKAVRTLSKTRLAQLLNEYVGSDGHRYYNVVHWLDLGISVPKDRVKKAAAKVIAKDWPESSPVFD